MGNSRRRRTGRHPDFQLDKPHQRDLYTKGELEALARATRMGVPDRLFEIGEKAHVSAQEAALSLGLDQSRAQIAERLIEDVVADIRGQYEIVKEAFEADIPSPAVKAILRRGQYMRYKDQALAKSKGMPEGTRSKHGGKAVVKRGGKWMPDTKGGGGGAEPDKGKKKGKGPDPAVSKRYQALKDSAAHHKINIKGDLADHHDHKHLDKLESMLHDKIGKRKKESTESEKKSRPAPDSAQGKQSMQQEVGDVIDKLSNVQHRIDEDHQPMFDRLMKEGKDVSKNPTGEAVDWYESRVDSFVKLATGKDPDGGDSGPPPGKAPDKGEKPEKSESDQKKYDETKSFFKGATKKLKSLGEAGVNRLVHAVKHTAEEFPVAVKAVGKLLDGEPLTGADRAAMVSVGVTLASVALAGFSYGASGAGLTFGQKMLHHAAAAAVHQHLATAYVGYSAVKATGKAAYILDLISKADDPKPIKGSPPSPSWAAEPPEKKKPEKPDTESEEGDEEPSKEMMEFAHGVLEQLQALMERDWSDDEIDYLTADEEGEEEIAKNAVYFNGLGEIVTGEEMLIKARGMTIGAISTYADGSQHKKVAPNKWVPVSDTRKSPRRHEGGLGREIKLSKAELDNMLKNGTYSIVSAGPTPDEADLSWTDPKIKMRHAQLRQDLESAGFSYTEVKGRYGKEEQSIIVMHDGTADPDAAKSVVVHHSSPSEFGFVRALGKKYGQESVIHSSHGQNEMHFTTGQHEGQHLKGSGFQYLPEEAVDLYTEVQHSFKIGDSTRFSLNFDWDSTHAMNDALLKADRPKKKRPPLRKSQLVIDRAPPPKASLMKSFGQLKTILKPRSVLCQLIDGQVRLLGDLEKAGVPECMLERRGDHTLLVDQSGVRDLLTALGD